MTLPSSGGHRRCDGRARPIVAEARGICQPGSHMSGREWRPRDDVSPAALGGRATASAVSRRRTGPSTGEFDTKRSAATTREKALRDACARRVETGHESSPPPAGAKGIHGQRVCHSGRSGPAGAGRMCYSAARDRSAHANAYGHSRGFTSSDATPAARRPQRAMSGLLQTTHHRRRPPGLCRNGKNIAGRLYSLIQGRPCALQVDPIEMWRRRLPSGTRVVRSLCTWAICLLTSATAPSARSVDSGSFIDCTLVWWLTTWSVAGVDSAGGRSPASGEHECGM